ncbi:MAG: transposase [Gammaproteobacteria bacterium]|nr:transposase [Gammaproteobacteria bacterium]
MITYTYKAKLNAYTHRNLAEFLTQQRLLYNGALQERIDCYQKTGDSISLFDQRGSLTTIRHTDEWFGKFDRWCQDSALVRVDRAFKRFFREGRGFPRFKSAKRGVMSFETLYKKPVFNVKYGSVKIKGIGRLRWRKDDRCHDREQVKLLRVVQRPTGVFIQLVCDIERPRIGLNRAIGIDVGVRVNAALSDGMVIPRHTPDRAEIRRKQRALSRCKRGSKGRAKRRQALARACYRARVQRHNALHRLTSEIVKLHGKWIAVEDLDIEAMTASAAGTADCPGRRVKQKTGLNRSILDQNWGMFIMQLDYKAASAGGQLVRVDPKHTTQRCSRCGGLPVKPLTLNDRWYHCAHCGYGDDRDVNASKNVLLKGLALFDAGGAFPAVSATEK